MTFFEYIKDFVLKFCSELKNSKMRPNKRKKDEISDYIDKVDAKEIDGEYGSVDLAAKNHKDRDRLTKSLENEKFEIRALL